MPAIQLTPAQRKEKRSEAHHLDPVVMIGADGLTPAVVKATDAALNAHGLIKVRIFFGRPRQPRRHLCQPLWRAQCRANSAHWQAAHHLASDA